MSPRFWALLFLIPSAVAGYAIAARRLRKKGKPVVAALSPLTFYRLAWTDYLALFGIAVVDLIFMLVLYHAGLIVVVK